MTLSLLIAAALTSTIPAQAGFDGFADDRAEALPGILSDANVSLTLTPDEIRTAPSQGHLTVQLVRESGGLLTPIQGLELTLNGSTTRARTNEEGSVSFPTCTKGAATVTATLTDEKFKIGQSSSQPYRLLATVSCDQHHTLYFKSDSDAGQAMGIFQVVSTAKRKLEETVDLAFWSSPIQFVWPSGGDYYSWGTVNLTRGDHWDVVGHEMGHAIYDLADIGAFGGGQHKIDECYSEALALSEGWASYFSAWVSVDLQDSDARFEFMVPRRAPIRFENVPEDVCKGHTNEWRVNAFFWDLVDLNEDGEGGAETFARVWTSLLKSNSRSAKDASTRLERAGLAQGLLNLVWELNFRVPR
jgi:hypothetical protein